MSKVLLKVESPEGVIFRVVEERGAIRVMNLYASMGWDSRIVGEAVENESGILVG